LGFVGILLFANVNEGVDGPKNWALENTAHVHHLQIRNMPEADVKLSIYQTALL